MKSKLKLFAASIAIYIIAIQLLGLLFGLGALNVVCYNSTDIVAFGLALLWLLLIIPVVKLLCFCYKMYGRYNTVLFLLYFIALIVCLGAEYLDLYLDALFSADSDYVGFVVYNRLRLIASVILTIGIVVYRNSLFKAEVRSR